MNGKLEIEL